MTKNKKNRFWLVAGLFLLISSCGPEEQKKRNTYIGNGGNHATPFLEGVRTALVKTLNIIKVEHKKGLDLRDFCQDSVVHVTNADLEVCERFILETIDPILELNRGKHKIPFEKWDSDTDVPGMEHVDPEDDAFTILGPSGPIFFKHFRLAVYTAMDALALMFHEFGHKAQFFYSSDGILKSYMEDDIRLGPPSRVGFVRRGRDLLYLAGRAVSKVADAFGVVGGKFIVEDTFKCVLKTKEPQGRRKKSKFKKRSKREVALPKGSVNGHFLRYRTGFGEAFGNDRKIYDSRFGKLSLNLTIEEHNGCNRVSNHRYTTFQIVKTDKDKKGGPIPVVPPVVLKENITCPPYTAITISYKKWSYTCRFKPPSGFIPKPKRN